MKPEEQIFNWLLGASVIFWSIMGFRESGFTLIRLSTAALNIIVGSLIICRIKAQMEGDLKGVLMSLPSFLIAGLSFRLTPLDTIWPIFPTILFIMGVFMTIISFLFLGENFAILPAVRNISKNGPYSFVRHPAYLGELLMVLACCWTIHLWWAVFLFMGLIILIHFRIKAEEKILIKKITYQQYQDKVPWKLLPYVW